MSIQDVAARNPYSLEHHCQDFPECWNCHRCNAWRDFWERIQREWAEAEKKAEFYPFDGVNDPLDYGCDPPCLEAEISGLACLDCGSSEQNDLEEWDY